MLSLRTKLDRLYNGRSHRASHFRYGLLAFDLVTISYFIVTSMVSGGAWLVYVDFTIAAVLLTDFAARVWLAKHRGHYLLQPTTVVDIVVIVTLLAPVVTQNFVFLRVIRALRLLRSYHVMHDLRREFKVFAHHEDVIHSIVNIFVFIFFITALVYVLQVRTNPDITNYIDALYFTVTTLTTTGFGDITLHGSMGRMLSVVIMVVGVGLFLRLVQTIFHPNKVRYKCHECGLTRHDPDAIHCKHCGAVIKITTEGE